MFACRVLSDLQQWWKQVEAGLTQRELESHSECAATRHLYSIQHSTQEHRLVMVAALSSGEHMLISISQWWSNCCKLLHADSELQARTVQCSSSVPASSIVQVSNTDHIVYACVVMGQDSAVLLVWCVVLCVLNCARVGGLSENRAVVKGLNYHCSICICC